MDKEKWRRQSLIFFYMHNLNLTPEERAQREVVADYRRAVADERGVDLLALLTRISKLPAFRDFISGLRGRSGNLEASR